MAFTFKFFNDAALTSEVSGNIKFKFEADGSDPPDDQIFYLGSTSVGRKLEATSNPGTDEIVLSVADQDATSGQTQAAITLALTAVDLDTATPGASLNLGPLINSEPANALEVHVRGQDTTGGQIGNYLDISMITNTVTESAQ